MDNRYSVGTAAGGPKNRAICDGCRIVANVLGMGYPIGKGWSPHSEMLAFEIVDALNEQVHLDEESKA